MIGPREENLKKLAGMLPSMIKGYESGELGGGNHLWLQPPRWSCPACLKLFGRKMVLGEIVKAKVCKGCEKVLKAGGAILVCDDARIVFMQPKKGSSGSLKPEYKGRVVKISQREMDRLHPPVKNN